MQDLRNNPTNLDDYFDAISLQIKNLCDFLEDDDSIENSNYEETSDDDTSDEDARDEDGSDEDASNEDTSDEVFSALGIEQTTSLSITTRELEDVTQLSHEIQSNTIPTSPLDYDASRVNIEAILNPILEEPDSSLNFQYVEEIGN